MSSERASSPSFFVWSLKSPTGAFTGEQKALLVDKMEEIAQLLTHGKAQFEFIFDEAEVSVKISAKTTPEMIATASAKARRMSRSGISGFVARALLFIRGLGRETLDELERRLTSDFLAQEQRLATEALSSEFKTLMAAHRTSHLPLGS